MIQNVDNLYALRSVSLENAAMLQVRHWTNEVMSFSGLRDEAEALEAREQLAVASERLKLLHEINLYGDT